MVDGGGNPFDFDSLGPHYDGASKWQEKHAGNHDSGIWINIHSGQYISSYP
jgi:hypothetical protein